MKQILLAIFLFSGLSFAQDSTIYFVGKWRISDPVPSDSSCSLDTSQIFFDTWQYEFYSNGTYVENRNDFCDGKYYKPHGEWKYQNGELILYETVVCNNSSALVFTFNLIWLSETMWYECGSEGDRYSIYVYKKETDG